MIAPMLWQFVLLQFVKSYWTKPTCDICGCHWILLHFAGKCGNFGDGDWASYGI